MQSVLEQEWIQHPQQLAIHPPPLNCAFPEVSPSGSSCKRGWLFSVPGCSSRFPLARADLIPTLPARCTAGESEPPPAMISCSLGRTELVEAALRALGLHELRVYTTRVAGVCLFRTRSGETAGNDPRVLWKKAQSPKELAGSGGDKIEFSCQTHLPTPQDETPREVSFIA